jgi:hypothetical protein
VDPVLFKVHGEMPSSAVFADDRLNLNSAQSAQSSSQRRNINIPSARQGR